MAGDDEAANTAAIWQTWLTPSAAVKSLNHLNYREAVLAIFERLKYGHIKSMARRFNYKGKSVEFISVSSYDIWQHAEHGIAISGFWRTGDITVQFPERSGASFVERPLALFGVRLDPDGINELLPAVNAGLARTPPKPIEPNHDPTPSPAPAGGESEIVRGPPVSDALLREWYALYQRAYPGASDTEPTAIRSAAGMFPGKYVARQKVRDLRGKRKPGRKPSESD